MNPLGWLIILAGAATAATIVAKKRAVPVVPVEPSPQGVDLHCWNCGYDFTAPLTADVFCPNCEAKVFDLEGVI